jgi:hypothetical protein
MNNNQSNPENPSAPGEEVRDAGIRLGGSESLREDGTAGPMNSTYSSVSNRDVAPGGTRDQISNELGGSTGEFLGGQGIAGTNLGSTDIGAADLTGGGDAAGLGSTDGGGTT